MSAGVLLLMIAWAATARAENEAARAHFEEGRRLARAERWQDAATEFRASLAIEPSVGGHLNLGNAYTKLGMIASAAREFRGAEQLAGPADDARASEARSRRAALAARVPTITVTGTAAATITIDATKVVSGVAIEVDPGTHAVVLVGAAGTPRSLDVDVRPGDHAKVVIAGDDGRPELSVAASGSSSGPNPLATIGWVGLGAGVVALAASAVFYGLAISDKKDLEAKCASYPSCTPGEIADARTLDDGAHTKTTIATIGLVSGLGLAAAGVVLLIAAPRSGVALSVSPGRQGAAATALVRW